MIPRDAPIYQLSIVSGRYLAISVNIVLANNPQTNIGNKRTFTLSINHYLAVATGDQSSQCCWVSMGARSKFYYLGNSAAAYTRVPIVQPIHQQWQHG